MIVCNKTENMADISIMYDAFKQHFDLIKELKVTDRTEEYICPICLNGYNKKDIVKLSLEDAPQHALGGRKIAITCRECNNICGHSIDNHLYNMLEYMERSHFLSGTDHRIKIMDLDKEKPINATLEVKGKDDLKMLISEKNNNPYTLKERLNKLVDGKEITIQNETIKVNIRRASAAIIKNAYIILFAKFGYSFILDKQYERIRDQIMIPEPYILPDGLWTMQKNLDLFDGVYLSGDNHYRGFFIAYTVMRRQVYHFLVFIPTPLVLYEEAAAIFRSIEPGDPLSLMRITNSDYLRDKENIQLIRNWSYSWNLNV